MNAIATSVIRACDFAGGTVIHVNWATLLALFAAGAMAVVIWRRAGKR